MTTREQRGLVQLVREVSRRQIAPRAAHRAGDQALAAELFALLAELDLLGLPFAVEDGGRAQSYATVCTVLSELSRAFLPVGLGAWTHLQATAVVADHGTAELRDDVLPRLVAGEWLAAHALPAAEVAEEWTPALRTRHHVDGYLVDGVLRDVSHAGLADCYVVPTTHVDAPDATIVLLIAADAAGLSWEPTPVTTQPAAATTGALRCRDVQVPLARRLRCSDDDAAIMSSAAAIAHLGVAACAVGLSRAALDVVQALTKSSGRAGAAVVVRSERVEAPGNMADLLAAVEAADAMCARAAATYDRGERRPAPAALARLAAVPTAVRAIDHCISIVDGTHSNRAAALARYRQEADLLATVSGGMAAARRAVASWAADGPDGRWIGANV